MNNSIKKLPNGDFIVNALAGAEQQEDDTPYELSTKEKHDEFVRKRNYHYSNTDNPIDFPTEWDNWKSIK